MWFSILKRLKNQLEAILEVIIVEAEYVQTERSANFLEII